MNTKILKKLIKICLNNEIPYDGRVRDIINFDYDYLDNAMKIIKDYNIKPTEQDIIMIKKLVTNIENKNIKLSKLDQIFKYFLSIILRPNKKYIYNLLNIEYDWIDILESNFTAKETIVLYDYLYDNNIININTKYDHYRDTKKNILCLYVEKFGITTNKHEKNYIIQLIEYFLSKGLKLSYDFIPILSEVTVNTLKLYKIFPCSEFKHSEFYMLEYILNYEDDMVGYKPPMIPYLKWIYKHKYIKNYDDFVYNINKYYTKLYIYDGLIEDISFIFKFKYINNKYDDILYNGLYCSNYTYDSQSIQYKRIKKLILYNKGHYLQNIKLSFNYNYIYLLFI